MQQIFMKLGEEYVCSFYCSFIFDRIKIFQSIKLRKVKTAFINYKNLHI